MVQLSLGSGASGTSVKKLPRGTSTSQLTITMFKVLDSRLLPYLDNLSYHISPGIATLYKRNEKGERRLLMQSKLEMAQLACDWATLVTERYSHLRIFA